MVARKQSAVIGPTPGRSHEPADLLIVTRGMGGRGE
jgi:hypothetical protein